MRRPNLPGEYELILLCSRQKPEEEAQKRIISLAAGPIDWERLITAGRKNEILPLIYQGIKRLGALGSVPDRARKTLEDAYYITLSRNLRFYKETSLVLEKFAAAGIKTLLLKGIALIETIYKNPGLRIMADADILVAEDKIAQAKQLLKESGYQEITKPLAERYIQKYQITFGFTKELGPGVSLYLDIHRKLIPDRPWPLKLPDIWERAQSIAIEGESALTLSDEDTFLFLALHLRGHLRQFLLLKSLCDIAGLINRCADTLDWDYITKAAGANRIRNNVYFALFACMEILDTPIPAAGRNLGPSFCAKKLISLCLEKNSFFALDRRRRFALRFLFFDRLIDALAYFFGVWLFERRIERMRFNKSAPK